MTEERFRDRTQAGQKLAAELQDYADRSDLLVLGLPRGGVPVAFEIAQKLGAPLDVFLVRKLGVPGREELAMGAIATGGVRVLNDEVVQGLHIADDVIDQVVHREQQELKRRERLYRGDRPQPEIQNRTVIIVDDGLATGATIRAAVKALRQHRPAHIVVAVPVAARETYEEFREEMDEIVCPLTPNQFSAVGLWYQNFSQTTDEEVLELLNKAWDDAAPG